MRIPNQIQTTTLKKLTARKPKKIGFGNTESIPMFKYFRKVAFDVSVEGEAFVVGLESLGKAIACFLHLCFSAHLEYPQVIYRSMPVYPSRYVLFRSFFEFLATYETHSPRPLHPYPLGSDPLPPPPTHVSAPDGVDQQAGNTDKGGREEGG